MDRTDISGVAIRRVRLCTKRVGLLLGRARMLELIGIGAPHRRPEASFPMAAAGFSRALAQGVT